MGRLRSVEVELEAVTPLWIGGASAQAELRPPSLRGCMRFWFRALAGGLLGESLENVWQAESAVYASLEPRYPSPVRPTSFPASLTCSGRSSNRSAPPLPSASVFASGSARGLIPMQQSTWPGEPWRRRTISSWRRSRSGCCCGWAESPGSRRPAGRRPAPGPSRTGDASISAVVSGLINRCTLSPLFSRPHDRIPPVVTHCRRPDRSVAKRLRTLLRRRACRRPCAGLRTMDSHRISRVY
jgi:hypothetical protein